MNEIFDLLLNAEKANKLSLKSCGICSLYLSWDYYNLFV